MFNNNKKLYIKMVMGFWYYGQWNSISGGKLLGEVDFGFDISVWFQEEVLLFFFKQYLKKVDDVKFVIVIMFEIGSNCWCKFDQWLFKDVKEYILYFGSQELLVSIVVNIGSSEYISDLNKLVLYFVKVSCGWDCFYMVEDQCYVVCCLDVLVFEIDVLENDLIIVGVIDLDLWFLINKMVVDIIVKLVDVFLGKDENIDKVDVKIGNCYELVCWGFFCGRFRDSMLDLKFFELNKLIKVCFDLYDVLYIFKCGYKV